MKLAPNLGSDRAWVWNVSADYAEGEPTAETLAIRFANTESKLWPGCELVWPRQFFDQMSCCAIRQTLKRSRKPLNLLKPATPVLPVPQRPALTLPPTTLHLKKRRRRLPLPLHPRRKRRRPRHPLLPPPRSLNLSRVQSPRTVLLSKRLSLPSST